MFCGTQSVKVVAFQWMFLQSAQKQQLEGETAQFPPQEGAATLLEMNEQSTPLALSPGTKGPACSGNPICGCQDRASPGVWK